MGEGPQGPSKKQHMDMVSGGGAPREAPRLMFLGSFHSSRQVLAVFGFLDGLVRLAI